MMTWTPLLSATLLGTLILVGAQNVQLESFRNSGFVPLNGAGSGLNRVQGNFGGVGAAAGSGVNRFGSPNRAGYNYPVPSNSLDFGGGAALGPAGGFDRDDDRSLSGPPVLQGNSGSLANTISQILRSLTGSQVSSVIGPSSGRNNLPIGNVNFFTASDPSETSLRALASPIVPVNNFRFLQPRVQTNAFVAIAPGNIPPAAGGQSALGGAQFQQGQQSFGAGGAADFRNIAQSAAPALPQPQAQLAFVPTPQQAPAPAPITPTLVAAPLPVGPAPAAVAPVAPAPFVPTPAAAAAAAGINNLPMFGILLGPAGSSGFQTQGTNFGNFQGFNNLPIDIANLGVGGQQFGGLIGGTQGGQIDLNLLRELAASGGAGGFGAGGLGAGGFGTGGLGAGSLGAGGFGAGGLGAGGLGAGGFGAGGLGAGGLGAGGLGAGGFGAGGLGAGSLGAGGLGAGGFGAGGFGAGQNAIGSGVGLQVAGPQALQGSAGTGLGAGGVGVAPFVPSGTGGVSNLVIGSPSLGATQEVGSAAGSGAAELASLAEPGQVPEPVGGNLLGGVNLRNLEQSAAGSPNQLFGVPLSLTGPQGPVAAAAAGLGGATFRNLEQPAHLAAGGALPRRLQTEINPQFVGLDLTGAQQPLGAVATGRSLQSGIQAKTMGVPLTVDPLLIGLEQTGAQQPLGAVATGRSLQSGIQSKPMGVGLAPQIPGSVAVDSTVLGRRTLQTESQVQLVGVSLSETGPQSSINTAINSPAATPL